ncbi:MAG: hypothetical protein H8F28_02705 [Fibrella sp.]|nr:hypothetical protein [Armatimonadota bacterium]
MLTINTIRTALQIYGAMNRHEYDLVDALREANGGRLRSHRAVTAVQATAGLAAPLILARSARQREKTAMGKSREMPRWTVRNALRLFGDRYRDAVGIAQSAVEQATGAANARNRHAMRKALRFYGDLWHLANPVPVLA